MTTQSDRIDVIVGRNIKFLRGHRAMSQSAIAERLGITFQQIQKYEKGSNRVSASKLFHISKILGVGIAELFQGANSPETEEFALNQSREALEVFKLYDRIAEVRTRKALHSLVGTIARSQGEA